MPAINVAKTDTFESQRQKINQIGAAIFNISQGGSDLSTGNLKLGDGTRIVPSLAFISDPSLGIYKVSEKTIGYVSDSKKLLDISPEAFYSFKDLIIQKKILSTSGITILNNGSNYDAGTYTNISITGGTGDGATANIIVTEFDGELTNSGTNYIEGSYSSILLKNGSGSGATVQFSVEGIEGDITNPGSGYIPGSYTNVPLTSVSPVTGTGATANITISGTTDVNGSINSPGSEYNPGTYNQITVLNEPTATYTVTTVSNPNAPPTNIYSIDGNPQQALTLIKGNTYRFLVSDPSNSGHQLVFQNTDGSSLSQVDYFIVSKGASGNSGAFVDLIIKPSAASGAIKYNCSIHDGMGAAITITTGTAGYYSSAATANITVNSSGNVSSYVIGSSGIDLNQGDIINVASTDIGGLSASGSGFEYEITGFTYTGEISSVIISSNGLNYVNDQILSLNNSSIGGFGSGFEYTISSEPGIIKDLVFTDKGSGYLVNDVLTLPQARTGVSTVLKGSKTGVSTTLSDLSKSITVSSTTGIVAGMNVFGGQTDTGQLGLGTTVESVDSLTTLTLSVFPTASGTATLSFNSPGSLNEISVTSVEDIIVGGLVTVTSGSGVLPSGTTVSSINTQNNTILLSENPTTAGSVVLTFAPPFGAGTNQFSYTIENLGAIQDFTISDGGNGYSENDLLSVNSTDLTQPITYDVKNVSAQTLTFTTTVPSSAFVVGDSIELSDGSSQASSEILQRKVSGPNITSILIRDGGFTTTDEIRKVGSVTSYTIDQVTNGYRYFIDYGFGEEITPNLTFYVGNTYTFDLSDSSNAGHIFSLSKFKDGKWSPSLVESVDTTLSSTSTTITVNSTSNILEGMLVTVTSGLGELLTDTKVLSVDNLNTITLDKTPLTSGIATLSFSGVEYTDSVNRTPSSLTIKVTENTPNLYYYCNATDSIHQNEGGEDNLESLITIDLNNPKIFGSNFSIRASEISSTNVIYGNILSGNLNAVSFTGEESTFVDQTITNLLTASNIVAQQLTVPTINSNANLEIEASNLNVEANLNIGSNIQIINSSGNLTTAGVLKSTNSINVNDILTLTNNTISSSSGNNIVITPSLGRVAKISTTTAITIPSGTTAQRPSSGIVESGSIRFNTDTNQYEGYSGTTSSWSSLGGVRDLDGNTYITAEESIGLNDNRLWFYNDNINTVRFTPQYQEFVNVKKIRSLNVSAPVNTNWTANTPVITGQFLKYFNNIYEVISSGTTGTSGNEPTDITGNDFANGTSTLRYFTTAVAPLTFEEISELRIAPLGGTSLSINNDLRLTENIISTDVNDLLIRPNSGKKVTIDANTSLVLPVGDGNERGAPIQGSVRFNTSISQYEGYDGTNWSSLGGVRDVSGDTYIIPELSAGSNENILYFYNNGSNTLRVTENEIELDTIDTINSVTSNLLNLNAELVTFNNSSASIDTSGSNTFITTTQGNLDLGLSSGLANDPLLRLSDTGDIYYNLGFGSGVYNGVKIFDSELKDLEIADFKISTTKVTLTRNTVNTGSATLYDPALHESAKVQIIAHNTITGNKEFVEYSVIDNGTDIFFTDFGNVKTGSELISCVFDFNANNNVRITFTLDTSVVSGNIIEVTVISNIIKR